MLIILILPSILGYKQPNMVVILSNLSILSMEDISNKENSIIPIRIPLEMTIVSLLCISLKFNAQGRFLGYLFFFGFHEPFWLWQTLKGLLILHNLPGDIFDKIQFITFLSVFQTADFICMLKLLIYATSWTV